MFYPAAVQGLAVLTTALIIGLAAAPGAGWAALYGGAAALVNTGLLVWRHRQGAREVHCDADRHLRSFYRSSLERFIVVGVWLALGLGGSKLEAAPMLAGFVVGLLAWAIAAAVRTDV
jgi:F0F1-type ATP synthase assembly protein I